jgi:hypothetical protein
LAAVTAVVAMAAALPMEVVLEPMVVRAVEALAAQPLERSALLVVLDVAVVAEMVPCRT